MGLSFDVCQCFPFVSALYCCAHVWFCPPPPKKQFYLKTDGQTKFTLTSFIGI